MMRNKLLAVLLASALLLTVPLGVLAGSEPEIRIQVDGIWLNTDVPPMIENGRTMVPFAVLLRALGTRVVWQEDTKSVVAVKGLTEISLTVDSRDAVINEPGTGERIITMDVPIGIISGRTMGPLRFVAEQLGAYVEWNGSEQTIKVINETQSPRLRSIPFEVIDPANIEEYPSLRQQWVDNHFSSYGIHGLMTPDWIYVLVVASEKPTGGYEIEVLEVTESQEDKAHITALLTVPGPHEQVTQALTYPYLLIRFSAEGIQTVGGLIREEIREGDPATERLSLELYFMQDTGSSFVAIPEVRTFDGPTVGARELIEALLEGPQSTELLAIIPEDTVLLDVYLDDTILYVDFSGAIREGPYGAESEAVLVTSIVQTLMQLDRVESVQILVEGAIIESIGGHVQINVPLK